MTAADLTYETHGPHSANGIAAAEREAAAAERAAERAAAAALAAAPVAPVATALDKTPVTYTPDTSHADYIRLKAMAAASGRPMERLEPVVAPFTPPVGSLEIPKDATPQEYRRLKALAQSQGRPYHVAEAR